MSKARLLAPWVGEDDTRSALYHCVSRIVGREFLLGSKEKEQFVKYMRLYEAFCGLRVLSYCMMSNHFHILVEVPPVCDQALSDEDLLERLRLLYSEDYVTTVEQHLGLLSLASHERGVEAHRVFREQFTRRMWDLSLFMKTLKQRFTTWYNRKHSRCGTLWEARYKSVLVENGYAARTMAAYIDLNPVRAGMVKDPKDYRWCSYAEAVAGGKLARNGVMRVLSEMDSDSAVDGWSGARELRAYDWLTQAGRYRVLLFEDGASFDEELSPPTSPRSKGARKGFSEKQREQEIAKEGEMSVASIANCKSRYFVDSVVLGTREWVDNVIEEVKGGYLRKNRKSASMQPQGTLKKSGLWSLRNLRET